MWPLPPLHYFWTNASSTSFSGLAFFSPQNVSNFAEPYAFPTIISQYDFLKAICLAPLPLTI